MYKIAIAAAALAVFAAPMLTGGAEAAPIATQAQAVVAGSQSAAPASTVVPVRHYYRYGHLHSANTAIPWPPFLQLERLQR